jgi:putative SOS response-associated peptidase YedK
MGRPFAREHVLPPGLPPRDQIVECVNIWREAEGNPTNGAPKNNSVTHPHFSNSLSTQSFLAHAIEQPAFERRKNQIHELAPLKLDAKGRLKQPYAIAMADDAQMVMAGLWAKWKSPTSGEEVLSCTILTCGPNTAMGELHDRMPVILAENDWSKWLGEEPASEQDLLALLKPCPDEALKIWSVDKMVGNVRNNGPRLILPVPSNAVPA